jgi:hypothetical protein
VPPRCCTSGDLRPPLLSLLETDGRSLQDAVNATTQTLTVACEHERHRSAQVSCGARFWLTDACPRFSTVAHKGASEPSSTGRLSCNPGMYLEEVPARFGREQGADVASCAPDGVNGTFGIAPRDSRTPFDQGQVGSMFLQVTEGQTAVSAPGGLTGARAAPSRAGARAGSVATKRQAPFADSCLP